MSSFKNQRVIIASLFLPNTAVIGDSGLATPELQPVPPSPHVPTVPTPARPTHSRKPSGPLNSIVDDLADRSRAVTPLDTSVNESLNPLFTRLSDALSPAPSKPISRRPSISGNASSDHSFALPSHIPHRIQRKSTRSVRRQPSDSPVGRQWHIDHNPHCNGGLHNAVMSIDSRLRHKLWVGTLGGHTDSFKEPLRRSIDRRMAEHDSLPVWIPDDEFTKYYDEFCHQVLWPALHYVVPDAPKTKYFYESSSYKQYVAVNQRFADAIVDSYREGDIIWVNDYHLMLLPRLLRERLPGVAIGFFMHVAFPSSEIFRCLAVREQLLRGLLGADLVGFQTANYARHFRQTVARILSYETVPKGIQTEETFVDVAVFPMGIDVKTLTEKKREPEVQHWVEVLRERYGDARLLVGRDKLDEVQGVRHKLLAFEAFLDAHPDFVGKAVLIQVALHTTEENELHSAVSDIVARINARYSTLTYQPVIFLHTEDLSFAQYLGLLTIADAFLVTSMREGMALRTHEFVECQERRRRPLILSEFTGTYSYSGFRSCIAVNPWDTRNTANAIYQALTMSDDEASRRWEDLHNHVITQTAQAFATSFLTRVLRTHLERAQSGADVAALDPNVLVPRYRYSSRRLILLDLEETLWDHDAIAARGAELCVPENALQVVKRLSEDSRNEVWLLSGFERKVLDSISAIAPQVGLVAENGCFVKTVPKKNAPAQWITMVSNVNLTWKQSCLEILSYFSERTPGSWVEEREASIVWRFWTSAQEKDRLWARRQAAEAQNHIFDSLGERFSLRIIPGETSFLVLPNFISRSTAVGAILHPLGPAQSPLAGRAVWVAPEALEAEPGVSESDFVLAVGKDEKLLRRLGELGEAETVSTGDQGRGTGAKWRVSREGVRAILEKLAEEGAYQ
ncbi:alpha-trehalose-phosphate synthase [Vararia minispora EC-137]|uniref:Alpha-trehalose-phosphate synthase n=1 Tax=Vararia minispora EC-137 TaxID=1314806 RepID=A0ACB8QMZ3_9AGAM|nr:alpha-trehalose-phosphate synthase [Vararia minispora EC-137]